MEEKKFWSGFVVAVGLIVMEVLTVFIMLKIMNVI